jgi:hypothetical protein
MGLVVEGKDCFPKASISQNRLVAALLGLCQR